MGCYINPRTTSKEAWLAENGTPTNGPGQITETHVPVVLVNNGPFNAAGVAFSQRELEAFTQPGDFRPKQWFLVSREAARTVSDLASWER
jgi:hypothetical protein